MANGDQYDGEWKADIKEGHGVLTYANGDQYDGEWKADQKEGHGVFTYSGKWKGDKYDGEWKNDVREGHGVCTFANGDKYDGEWKADKKEGHGVYTASNGVFFRWILHENQLNGNSLADLDREAVANVRQKEPKKRQFEEIPFLPQPKPTNMSNSTKTLISGPPNQVQGKL